MNKTLVNFVIDSLSFLGLCGTVATGLLIKYLLPPRSGGMGRGGGLTLWGWNRHDWGDLHFYIAIGLLALLLLHVTLHWHWLVMAAGRFASPRTAPAQAIRIPARNVVVASSLALIAICVAVLFWAASRDVERRDRPRAFDGRGWTYKSRVDQVAGGAPLGSATGRDSRGGWHGGRPRLLEDAP